jgi:hypothetical protein
VAVLAPVAVVCLLGVVDAMTCSRSYFALRKHAVLLGRWLQDQPDRPAMLVGPTGMTQIVGYYAGGIECRPFRQDIEDPDVVIAMVEQFQPGVLLLHPTHGLREKRCEAIVQRVAPLGLELTDPIQPPDRSDRLRVLLRRRPAAGVAGRPGRVAGVR